jgi:hypothetical protein
MAQKPRKKPLRILVQPANSRLSVIAQNIELEAAIAMTGGLVDPIRRGTNFG